MKQVICSADKQSPDIVDGGFARQLSSIGGIADTDPDILFSRNYHVNDNKHQLDAGYKVASIPRCNLRSPESARGAIR